jgi:hypothetical protein
MGKSTSAGRILKGVGIGLGGLLLFAMCGLMRRAVVGPSSSKPNDGVVAERTIDTPSKTDLDIRIEAAFAQQVEHCKNAATFNRVAENQSYDLNRGIRTGSLSAREVRADAAELAATKSYAKETKAQCATAQAEVKKLAAEAVRVVAAAEKKIQPASRAPASRTPAAGAPAARATAERAPKP